MKTKLKVLLNAVLIKSARQRLKMKMLVTLLIFLFSEHRKINLHFIKLKWRNKVENMFLRLTV